MSHLYNLRGDREYISKRRHWTKTRSTKTPIGERRPPSPEGTPGYLRIDSVHQGDQDRQKGVSHINAVDSVTQYQVMVTLRKDQRSLPGSGSGRDAGGLPVRGSGHSLRQRSEYINYTVAKLLEKLRIDLTKSRPRHSNDNTLAESKNAAVVRKHLGYAHIPQIFAREVNAFCQGHLNPMRTFIAPASSPGP